MKRLLTFKTFVILFLCIFCIDVCTSASVLTTSAEKNGHVANYNNNLVIQNLLQLSSLLKSIPIIGSLVNNLLLLLINFLVMFEYTTNNMFDKILRNSLPCTISSASVHCEGVYKNGGMNNILRRAIDTMPDTTPLYFIKKFLDPLVMIGSFLIRGSLY